MGRAHSLPDKQVALLTSAPFADPGSAALTDATGTATLQLGIHGAWRHTYLASGPHTIRATDRTNTLPLDVTAQVIVYNRVVVMLAGLGNALSCSVADCYDRIFASLSADALAPLGYNLNGDGVHRTGIEYGYRGGAMDPGQGGTPQWLVHPYAAFDTVQPLERSEAALRTLLRAAYPYTTFELIGHSLGGLVALEGLPALVARSCADSGRRR